jgi:hypothetical protein
MTQPEKPQTQPQLTDKEVEKIRAILEQDDFVRKFWSTARTWIIAFAAVAAGLTVGVDALARVMKFLVGR